MIHPIIECLKKHKSFEIITHEGPDADAVGSSRALGFALKALGKQIRLVYPTPIQDSLLFTSTPKEERLTRAEVSIILDSSNMALIGDVRPQGKVVVIDHHCTNNGFGDLSWVDGHKSSTSEMIFDLLKAMQIDLTPAMASNLYMGIFGDTGGFMHSNTSARVFEVAHELASCGADPNLIGYKLKRCRSMAYYQLLCMVMDRLLIEDGVYASYIGLDDMNKIKARTDDASGIVEEIASLADAELVILLKELNPDSVHCSMRSKRRPSALRTAQNFGGGGHNMAAGFTLPGRARDLVEDVFEEGLKWVETA